MSEVQSPPVDGQAAGAGVGAAGADDVWAGVAGQPHVVQVLTAAAAQPVHAYLFCGPRGTGKHAAALAFASLLVGVDSRSRRLALAGRHPDVAFQGARRPDTAGGRSRRDHLRGVSQPGGGRPQGDHLRPLPHRRTRGGCRPAQDHRGAPTHGGDCAAERGDPPRPRHHRFPLRHSGVRSRTRRRRSTGFDRRGVDPEGLDDIVVAAAGT